MTIQIGDVVPDGTLQEYIEEANATCTVGPNSFKVKDMIKGKTIVVFGLPGAFTPTCSSQQLPGYVKHAAELQNQGVDEIWCVSVNDAFVMGAWGRDQKTQNTIRMLADGNAEWTKALGLTEDMNQHGMGIRSTRYSMLLVDGIVKQLNKEERSNKFEISDAETMLAQLEKEAI